MRSASCIEVSPRRRLLMLSLLAGATLSVGGCSGGSDEAAPSEPPKPGQSVSEAARALVNAGLVGGAVSWVDTDPAASASAVAGVRCLGTSNAISLNDVFDIGSNMKAMTAMVIASVVAQGRLTFETRIAQALPALSEVMRPEYAQVTLEHLLNHQGGVLPFQGQSDDETQFFAALQADEGAMPETPIGRRRYFAAWLVQQAPAEGVRPGLDFLYSNAGYALAAAMVEAVTGETFESIFEAQIVGLLGVAGQWRTPAESPTSRTSVQPCGHEGAPPTLNVYVPSSEIIEADPWVRVLAPSGNWVCTVDAYARWLRWHLLALQGASTPLPGGYLVRLQRLVPDAYAMGWACKQVGQERLLMHTGSNPGFMAEVALALSGRYAVSCFCNNEDDSSGWVFQRLDQALGEVLRRYRRS